MSKMKNGRAIRWLAIFCILVSCVAASARWGPRLYSKYFDKQENTAKQEEMKYATASRGELRVTVVEDGKLRAIKNHAIFPQLRGQSRPGSAQRTRQARQSRKSSFRNTSTRRICPTRTC